MPPSDIVKSLPFSTRDCDAKATMYAPSTAVEKILCHCLQKYMM